MTLPDPLPATGDAAHLHATCIAAPGPDGAPLAALLLGRSGSGKSALALDLIARGALLVSDDLTKVERRGEALVASCPRPAMAGLIEARGIGLLRAPHLAAAPVALLVDLDAPEQDRLPPPRRARLLGLERPRILCGAAAGAPPGEMPGAAPQAKAAAVLLLLRAGGAPVEI